jgi:hypothetical protein
MSKPCTKAGWHRDQSTGFCRKSTKAKRQSRQATGARHGTVRRNAQGRVILGDLVNKPKTGQKAKTQKKAKARESAPKGDCCKQRVTLMRSVLRLSARLATYRAKEEEVKAKSAKNKSRREKAVERRTEIKILADAAGETLKAISRGEHMGTYDKFMTKTVTDVYGYNDKEFERITSNILRGTVSQKNPPKAAVAAIKKVDRLMEKGSPGPLAANVIHNVQSLVKRKQ